MSDVDYDKLKGEIWFDGEFIPWHLATTHVLTHGLHYATSVFEGIRAYGGRIFEMQAHTDRLFRSAAALDMPLPYTPDEINDAMLQALERNQLTDSYIRPVAWRGSKTMGISVANNPVHVAIAAWTWPSYYPPEREEKGISLEIATYRRPDPATIPCHSKSAGLYMICTISREQANRNSFDDALMLDYRGRVAECTGANIFFISNGELHTPTPDCFLDGITRRTVIQLARSKGVTVNERVIDPSELMEFSACFITGTAIEVMPINCIGDIRYEVDALTRSLRAAYRDEVNAG